MPTGPDKSLIPASFVTNNILKVSKIETKASFVLKMEYLKPVNNDLSYSGPTPIEETNVPSRSLTCGVISTVCVWPLRI